MERSVERNGGKTSGTLFHIFVSLNNVKIAPVQKYI